LLTIPIGQVCDDPSVRMPLSHREPKPYGPVNVIAEDYYEKFSLQ
jgi:hypothetical protein